MSNYTKSTDFASKDALLSGDPNKIVRGSEIDDEFNALQVAVNSKANTNSPTLTGTPLAPTATTGTNTTQIATTAFVTTAVAALDTSLTADIATAVDNISTLDTWTIVESDGVLYFKVSGVSKAKLDDSGNLTVVGNITGYGSV